MKREFPFKCPEEFENSQFGINASNYTRSLPIYIPSPPRLLFLAFWCLSLVFSFLTIILIKVRFCGPPLVLFLPLHPYLLLYARCIHLLISPGADFLLSCLRFFPFNFSHPHLSYPSLLPLSMSICSFLSI